MGELALLSGFETFVHYTLCIYAITSEKKRKKCVVCARSRSSWLALCFMFVA